MAVEVKALPRAGPGLVSVHTPALAIQLTGTIAKRGSRVLPETTFVFAMQNIPSELLTKHPALEISISQHIASALGFQNRSEVIVSTLGAEQCTASHVEIAVRDVYLTRADMWRLIVSELAGKSLYKGQKLLFMNTIKAQVRTIYQQGQKVQAAFFGRDTKPVFRSESARYVLFIQMSREMWDFDADGTGEIMFNKVINGFLPELFKRWQNLGVRHSVSVVLFTRMEYDVHAFQVPTTSDNGTGIPSNARATAKRPHRDFYRVLVSDMSSSQSAMLLSQLKREFKVFLRDVSILSTPSFRSSMFEDESPFSSVSGSVPKEVIAGRPAAAMQGNILEAINIASSHFSGDYIDRDLIRTGLSIVVITAGTGVYEVDYSLLSITTDTLIENGVSIDLVCLSRMPLHSVPLFKYRRQKSSQIKEVSELNINIPLNDNETAGSLSSTENNRMNSKHEDHRGANASSKLPDRQWRYGIPHWVHVSFWTTPLRDTAADRNSAPILSYPASGPKPFVPRVRMYEIQMMGIMENDLGEISLPYLRQPASLFSNVGVLKPAVRKQYSILSLESKSGGTVSPSHLLNLSAGSCSPSKHPYQTTRLHTFGRAVQWMEDYDVAVFKRVSGTGQLRRKTIENRPGQNSNSIRIMPPTSITKDYQTSIDTVQPTRRMTMRKASTASNSSAPILAKPWPSLRQISVGFRGMSIAASKATPIAEISSENAFPDLLGTRATRPLSSQSQESQPRTVRRQLLYASTTGNPLQPPSLSRSTSTQEAATTDGEPRTKPINIHKPQQHQGPTMGLVEEHSNDEEMLPTPVEDPDQHSAGLSPRKAMAPWLTVLNPSNPREIASDPTSRLGRWHHVFPRPVHSSSIKWKSMCSPASVPLTTEDFPSKEQLAAEYTDNMYSITSIKDDPFVEVVSPGSWLPRELVGARFSRGFQVVVGPRVLDAISNLRQDFTIFDDEELFRKGSQIIMSRGSQIHHITVADDASVEVKQYVRRPTASPLAASSFDYEPLVRTSLSELYTARKFAIAPMRETYDWHRLDKFIANQEDRTTSAYPESLCFWRARFVLIPTGLLGAKRRMHRNEDNDEEVRLEGIRKLTQTWQKNKYVPPEERRFQSSTRNRKDNNPLDIIYQTRTPSAVVSAELNDALLLEHENRVSKPAQLLPDSDLFERSNLKLPALAQTIQGERGVKMMDRRWHWRLHYNCFIGMEFTTWLLNSFRDIDNREEAVELGNELMKSGLFVHVERRHNFRDGNFFYQIASEYRIPRTEAGTGRGWFGRIADRSVPVTPNSEHTRYSSSGLRSRSSSTSDHDGEPASEAASEEQKLGVTLSKRFIYDMDPRKRSYRQELLVLHYDRISSADDCYHLRIHWMNVTPKLIEDAIVNWAALTERSGLRLVELPILEASRVSDVRPFEGPYIVKLAKQPPEKQPKTYFDAVSLTPQAKSKHPYHKAILKKFNFVLDLEAAKDFPPSVDVTYSWGKPDYQYPQYISRDGMLLAQITDEGDFVLLANRLYNSRSTAARDSHRALNLTGPDVDERLHRSPARRPSSGQHASPRASPFSSPMIRATLDSIATAHSLESATPEGLKADLETFCSSVDALERFYEEELHKTGQTASNTPLLATSVASLVPPPAFSLRDCSPSPAADGTSRR